MVQLPVLAPAAAQPLLDLRQGSGVAEETALNFTLPAAPAASRDKKVPGAQLAQYVRGMFLHASRMESTRIEGKGHRSAGTRSPAANPLRITPP
ncbi:hypothetical protein [Geminicoccus flavidas]|uniref:hypothetical protein n=1 Tax=Geminicoccus flavidas TaxID=2506407 RepID=UPI0013592357|nr:hypothetical protein [Geminicoccus flavidas]